MFSTPLTSCSIGVATVVATTLAFAPGYIAVTSIVGGATSGYCESGKRKRETPPIMTMTTERTVAKMGRSTKKRVNIGKPTQTDGYNPPYDHSPTSQIEWSG